MNRAEATTDAQVHVSSLPKLRHPAGSVGAEREAVSEARVERTKILDIRDLEFSYGSSRILQGISLSLRPGEVLGLLGPNGAGKSTLLSIIMGLKRPSSGSVDLAPGVQVGFMPQEDGTYPMLTARENLAYVGRAWGLKRVELRSEISRVLEIANLTQQADQLVGTYSGGMRRRLSAAAALLGNPPLLLLDEPTVGVDPQSRLAILDIVEECAKKGTGIIYSTHYMEEVEKIAENVAVLHQGDIIACSSVEEILDEHGETYIGVTISSDGTEEIIPRLSEIRGISSVSEEERDGKRNLRLFTSDPAHQVGLIVRTLTEAGAQILALRFSEPTLEAVFIAMTGRELRD